MRLLTAVLGARATDIVLRSVHTVAMGLLLGGVALGADHATLRLSIHVTIVSGVLLHASGMLGRRLAMTQGSGVVVLLKLALLALGSVFPADRLPWYIAGTFVACLGAHMPGAWRHFSFITWQVVKRPRKLAPAPPGDRAPPAAP